MLQEWSGIDRVLYLGMDHFLSIQVTKTQLLQSSLYLILALLVQKKESVFVLNFGFTKLIFFL